MVVVRPWAVADAARLDRAVRESLDHLRPWMAWVGREPAGLRARREMIARWAREAEAGGDAVFGVFFGSAVAGGAGLHQRSDAGVLEIGYWVHPGFLRRGIATRTAAMLTSAAFSVPGVERVEIHHDRANRASAGVPRRLGYSFTAERPDVPAAPAEIGVDCTWTMTPRRWADPSQRETPRSSSS